MRLTCTIAMTTRAFVFVVVFSALTACRRGATTPEPQEVEAKVHTLQVIFPSEDRAAISVEFDMNNRRPAVLEMTEIRWDLFLNKYWFASGVQRIEAKVPPRQPSQLVFETDVPFARAALSGQPVSTQVRLTGTLQGWFGSERVQTRIEHVEEMKLERAPLLDELFENN
jgi:hypothetical protein